MTSSEMARSHVRHARRFLDEAERYRGDEAWNLVVRRCQEAVELALKALLRGAAIEVPHVHDVGVFVREHADRLPPTLTAHLDDIVSISRRLRQERELALYGDDEAGAPPEALYTVRDAAQALADGRFVVGLVEDALRELK